MGRARAASVNEQSSGLRGFDGVFGTGRGRGRARDLPKTLTVVNTENIGRSSGRAFTFRLITPGDFYGADDRIQLAADEEPRISIYDAEYAGQKSFGELGQLTPGTYYLSTLQERVRAGRTSVGLSIDNGVPEWYVDAEAMRIVDAWLEQL
jgi:hypothetical protein